MQRKWLGWVAAGCLLLVMVLEVALSTRHESLSWDEGDHIYSGYMNWQHDEYDLNPEHPPLVKLVATLPLLGLHLNTVPRQGRYFKDEAYSDGRALLFENDPKHGGQYSAESLIFRIHMTVLVFALGLALLLFVAGREMFGPLAGLIAMTLFVFDPTVLTNAPFVTTDSGAACGFFASVYMFYRFVKRVTWQRAVACGVVTGFALVTKHSTVLLLPILILLGLGELAGRWIASRARAAEHVECEAGVQLDSTSQTRDVGQPGAVGAESRGLSRYVGRLLAGMAGIAALAVFVLWAVYSFRFAMVPHGVEIPSFAARVSTRIGPALRGIVVFCEAHHLLPESYLYGLVDVERVGLGMPSYIFGTIHPHGVWYYFPSILSLKWSVGVLMLLLLGLGAYATGRVRRPREVCFLALPAGFYLAVAMAGPENIGVRHVLPVFPFTFLLIGGGVAWLLERSPVRQRRAWAVAVVALLAWHVTDSLRMFPNYMPYANVLWGGPSKTNQYFSDSATDWGQELKFTKQWLDARGIRQCWFAYFPGPWLLPSDYGIPCRLLPTADTQSVMDIDVPAVVHGPVLVSYADLNGFEYGSKALNPYETLFERKPDAVIANGIAVFEGDFNLPDAAAIRFLDRASKNLESDPQASLAAAREAVALVPQGLKENRALGDAEAAVGDKAAARAAYTVVLRQVPKVMEPAQAELWRQAMETKLAALGS